MVAQVGEDAGRVPQELRDVILRLDGELGWRPAAERPMVLARFLAGYDEVAR